MNKYYIRDNEEHSMTSQRDNEEHSMTSQRDNNRYLPAGWWIMPMLLFAALLVAMFFAGRASAQQARTATITFTAPTTRTGGTNIAGALSYEVWQGLKGATKTKAATITTSVTTNNSGLQGGSEYCWAIVVVEAGNATPSAMSSEACKFFDLSGPNVVTITVT